MRFGCCVGLDKAEIVQEAGYDYIELPVSTVKAESPDSEFEPILEQVHLLEIVPEAWNCLLPGDMKVTGPEVDKYRVERYLRTAFERIEELGGEIVVFGSGGARTVPEGFPREEAWQQLVEFVSLAGQVAGTHGITIAIEPLNSKESNIINSVAEAVELAKAADHPFVRVLADLYHIDEEKEPLEHILESGDYIVHTHTADTGRFYPGSGSYPHREFFRNLRAVGYNDRMSVECRWNDFESECRKALEFLRGIDAEIS